MARPTAPSMWLPGFDPVSPELPDPSFSLDLFGTPPILVASDDPSSGLTSIVGTVDPEILGAVAHASWRVVTSAQHDGTRSVWPLLGRERLLGLSGAVTKFDANLAAIRTLQRLEAERRLATDDERSLLLRFTGWGGIPAAFNLEGQDESWTARAKQLVATLSPDDHASALASVNNSHYTEIHAIEAMWQAVQNFGFDGGRVLEPSAGVGHFIGAMPASLAERCSVTAVELDQVAGRLLRALYGHHGVDVRIAAFERVSLPENWFDLVIGNVPFGSYKVADASHRAYARFSIHNYFFGRALDLVRPGGLVCFITSSHTMESQSDNVREYIASQAELLGAIRLPTGAFAGLAATEVQTDILFLRKRQRGEQTRNDWVGRSLVPETMRDRQCPDRYPQINNWYVRQPQFCIGRIAYRSNGYDEVPTAVFEGDLEAALRDCVGSLPIGGYKASIWTAEPAVKIVAPAGAGARPGSYRLLQERVHRVVGLDLVDVHDELNATLRSRITGLCAIREHARALLDAQVTHDDDEPLRSLRAMLNGTYDRYVARHGCLSNRANTLAFRRDPDYPLLLSLEHYDEESETATKAALFSRRTLRRVSAPTSVRRRRARRSAARAAELPRRAELRALAAIVP